ncbi:MAG: M56 family metallopeptidase, partial [Solirubrobacterales bacterium]
MPLLENLFSPGTIERLGWMLVHFLWQAIAVALLLGVLLRLLRRAGSNARYAAACGALALMLVLPLITMQFVEVSGPVAEAGPLPELAQMPIVEPLLVTVVPAGELPPLGIAPPLENADVAVSVPLRERIIATVEPALPYIVLGWLAGVFGLSAWHLGGWTQLQRLKHRMARQADANLRATLQELATKLGIRRAVTLLESAIVEVPTVLGWLRPVILLPANVLTGLTPDQLRAILAHELAHIRRCDYLANILQTVVEILGFYHPAVWWVSSRIRIERENCCDDLAVHVCGDSLQYAKALTSLEEIRHSRSDLALAASGGSLMARIARLLGRPVVDDRRFAWLPGLIALLLVVSVVIPAALAFAHPTQRVLEPPAEEAPTAANPVDETVTPAGSSDTQIMVGFVLADVFSGAVLDPETATQAAGLLERLDGSTVPPTVEELRRPLAEVLSTFTPVSGRANEFVNLLGYKGYAAAKLSTPRVTVQSGEPESFSTSDTPDAGKPRTYASEFIFSRYEFTATEVPNQNAIRVDVNMLRTYPVYKPRVSNDKTATWALNTTVLVPNGQWTLISGDRLKRTTNDGKECLQLPLILATIVDQAQTKGTGNASVESVLSTTSPDLTQVLVKFSLFPTTSADKAVDIETRNLLAGILTKENLQPLREIVHADPQQAVTLGELLETWIAKKPMTPETLGVLIDVLQSRGYLDGESTPEVLTNDNQEARISIGSEEMLRSPTDPTSAPQPIKLGTFVEVTPRMPRQSSDRIVLDLHAQWTERDDPNDRSDAPIINTTEMATTIAMLDGQCVALTTGNAGKSDARLHMLLVTPTKVARSQTAERQAPSAGAETTIKSEPQTDANEPDKAQILTDWVIAKVRTETVLDRKTRRLIGDVLAPDNPQTARELADSEDMTLGQTIHKFVANRSLPQETGQTLIDLLETCELATVLSTPALIATNGRQYELRSISEEKSSSHRLRSSQAVEEPNLTGFDCGTIIRSTAHIEQDDTVTLDMSVALKGPEPRADPNALPVVRETGASTAVNVPNNRYFSLLVEPTNHEDVKVKDAESVLVMVKPSIVRPTPRPENPSAARPPESDKRPAQILLDVRVVEMKRANLMNLGVEWKSPTMQAGESGNGDGWTRAIGLGYSADAKSTSTLMQRLNLLEHTDQVEIVSNPQIVALDGRAAQLRSIQEEWFLMTGTSALSPEELRKIESGTILSFTPRVGDNNEITLDMTT